MTATGTGAGELRDQAAKALADYVYGDVDSNDAVDRVLAAIAEAGPVPAPAGGTLTPDVRVAVERMVDGIDTGEDRNVVRRWLGR